MGLKDQVTLNMEGFPQAVAAHSLGLGGGAEPLAQCGEAIRTAGGKACRHRVFLLMPMQVERRLCYFVLFSLTL